MATSERSSVACPDGPAEQVGIGVIVPYDMALDRELWRWAPADVSLFFTRTPFSALPVSVEMAELVSEAADVQSGVEDLSTVSPAVTAYACTSGSFVGGVVGERRLVEAMRGAGARGAVTTSGALLAGLTTLAARRVAIATPYDRQVTDRLSVFLAEAGVEVTGAAHLSMGREMWKVPYARTVDLVLEADTDEADAVVVSCTNLPTYDMIAPLERALGKPVLTANQATMWAALGAVGKHLEHPGQRLGQALTPARPG